MSKSRVRLITVAAEDPGHERADSHDEPNFELPDPSMQGIEGYQEMYRAVGNRVRYKILRPLVYTEETRAILLAEESAMRST